MKDSRVLMIPFNKLETRQSQPLFKLQDSRSRNVFTHERSHDRQEQIYPTVLEENKRLHKSTKRGICSQPVFWGRVQQAFLIFCLIRTSWAATEQMCWFTWNRENGGTVQSSRRGRKTTWETQGNYVYLFRRFRQHITVLLRFLFCWSSVRDAAKLT